MGKLNESGKLLQEAADRMLRTKHPDRTDESLQEAAINMFEAGKLLLHMDSMMGIAEVGKPCKLKGGSPPMTVGSISEDGTVVVLWFDSSGNLCNAQLDQKLLMFEG